MKMGIIKHCYQKMRPLMTEDISIISSLITKHCNSVALLTLFKYGSLHLNVFKLHIFKKDKSYSQERRVLFYLIGAKIVLSIKNAEKAFSQLSPKIKHV